MSYRIAISSPQFTLEHITRELVAVTPSQLPLLRNRLTRRYAEQTSWPLSRNAFMVEVQMNPFRNLEENDCQSPLLYSPKRTSEGG